MGREEKEGDNPLFYSKIVIILQEQGRPIWSFLSSSSSITYTYCPPAERMCSRATLNLDV